MRLMRSDKVLEAGAAPLVPGHLAREAGMPGARRLQSVKPQLCSTASTREITCSMVQLLLLPGQMAAQIGSVRPHSTVLTSTQSATNASIVPSPALAIQCGQSATNGSIVTSTALAIHS